MKATLSSLAEVLAAQRRASRSSTARKKATPATPEPNRQPSAAVGSKK